MAILTKFLQLLKPEKNDYVDVEKHLSENYDKIDAKMEELSNSNDEKLNKGNVPDVLNSAEKIIKALQGNTGIKFDESLLYLNDSGTKKKGYCYIDKLTDGIFECIQETTTTVNNATYFKNFSNKENSDRLSNLNIILYDSNAGIGQFTIPEKYRHFKLFLVNVYTSKNAAFDGVSTYLMSIDSNNNGTSKLGFFYSESYNYYFLDKDYTIKIHPLATRTGTSGLITKVVALV